MSRGARAGFAPLVDVVLIALVAAGCASTVDESIAASGDTVVTTTLPPVARDAPLEALVDELAAAMRHLDEEVVAGEHEEVTLARIEEIWSVAEPLARERSTDVLFGLEKSVELARTSVERRRPADASKGYKIVAALLDRLS